MLNAKRFVNVKTKLSVAFLVVFAFVSGIFFQKILGNVNFQKTIEHRYVKLKQSRVIVPIGGSEKLLLPKGMVIYFDYSHKDFYSYASIPIKTDFDDFRNFIEDSRTETIYKLE